MCRGENVFVGDETSTTERLVKTFLDQSNLPREFIADDFFAANDPVVEDLILE
jgi:hypothetical protein